MICFRINRILDVIGRDAPLQLQLPSAKSPLRYPAGSQTLISLSGIRNATPNRSITTWYNAATRLTPKEFYEPRLNHQIAIREMGGVEAFNDSIGRLSHA